ncbi:MAG: hypothetical protein JW840_08870 [Candidatus Thermoplasmatota archaeon]|nr:hypothetical protein [Candidatus Thermoplasmatota archaeon]
MKQILEKKIILLSLGIAAALLMLSFSSTVAFQSMNVSETQTYSPLFQRRLNTIITSVNSPSFSSSYLGQDKSLGIPLPTREIFSEGLLIQLSSHEISDQINQLDSSLYTKWRDIVSIAENNIEEINRVIRQDYAYYQRLYAEFSGLSAEQATELFLEKLSLIDCRSLSQGNIFSSSWPSLGNITTRPICNITSGPFCQVTSQPICQITTQPICLITKGFFCWTIYGPICPTTGIKCHPPTSRPVLCGIFAAAGKILKAIIIVLLLATVIFVPLAILSLVFITVFNPERCEQIHERITLWFNCTVPE